MTITGRLNTQSYGNLLGEFDNGDSILVLFKDGTYEVTNYELTNRYEPDKILSLEKLYPEKTVISAIYWNGERQATYIKRFHIETTSLNEKYNFMADADHSETKIVYASTKPSPKVEYKMKLKGKTFTGEIDLVEFIDVKGWKAMGNKFSSDKITISKEIEVEKPILLEVQEEKPEISKPAGDLHGHGPVKLGETIELDF